MVMTSIDDVLSDYVLIDCVLVNYVFTYVLSDDFLL